MFIKSVMHEILRPVSERYVQDLQCAKKMKEEEIIAKIYSNAQKIDSLDKSMHGTVVLATPGCPHNVKNGMHCGCSFCDWNNSYVANPALVSVLREKNPEEYRKMQLCLFEKARGIGVKPKLMEEIAIHDCFDPRQITAAEMKEFFDKAFSEKPVMGLLQVRAEHVSYENIRLWKPFFRKVMTLGIGVETGNEWLRNHWLNKHLKDAQLIHAIKISHDEGCYVSANILISLPGLTVRQNCKHFIDTIIYLDSIGCDSIMISPLVNKYYTIQQYLDCPERKETQLRLYEVTEALYSLSQLAPAIQKKIMFSILNFEDFFQQIPKTKDSLLIISCIQPMLSIGGMKNLEALSETINKLRGEYEYQIYLDKIHNEFGWDKIGETLEKNAELLCDYFFKEEQQQDKLIMFRREVQKWKEATDDFRYNF